MNPKMLAVHEELPGIAEALDHVLEEIACERVAFMLVVFTPERAGYISSAGREETVREMTHLFKLWEEGMPDTPAQNMH